MKRFMMFSVSILCLSIAVLIGFYIGSQRVEAQAPAETMYFCDASVGYVTAILPNGDVYYRSYSNGLWTRDLQYLGDFWGGLVPTASSSWGNVKGMKQ